MNISDPIADMLTRIRNAGRAGHEKCIVTSSKIKKSILEILKEEGFISNFQVIKNGEFSDYEIQLKYSALRVPVINKIERVSKPGRRIYIDHESIKPIRSNLGISILSTSKGIMTGKKAKKLNIGGEFLCLIY
ncbi:MAG: 30S ribosomal protein S8 [Leptospiraceae bacterium]|nr:30S ribosomal protein S8 [Leptospiraceae bacterium]MCK6380143.1 30S ribosomal protein S8 [Leptospiraceae bacterium]NUM42721.1 30S ribosomal protein S8 [Leptospiraceae bacterium]